MLKHVELLKKKFNHVVSKVTIQQIKVQKPMKYSCHICSDIGHRITNNPKFNDMHNMFKNKGVKITKKPFVVKPKVVNPSIRVMDVNMVIIRSKVIEEQVFKDKELTKKKSIAN